MNSLEAAALDLMKGCLDQIEQEKGATAADFFRAHYQGCLNLVTLRNRYCSLPPCQEKTDLKVEIDRLFEALRETTAMLKGVI